MNRDWKEKGLTPQWIVRDGILRFLEANKYQGRHLQIAEEIIQELLKEEREKAFDEGYNKGFIDGGLGKQHG